MASEENPLDQSNTTPPKQSNKGGKGTLIGLIAIGIIASLALAASMLSLMANGELTAMLDHKMRNFSQKIETELNELASSPDMTDEQLELVSQQAAELIAKKQNFDARPVLEQLFKDNREGMVDAAAKKLGEKLPTSANGLDEEDVKRVVNLVFDQRTARLQQMFTTKMNEVDNLRAKLSSQSVKAIGLQNQIDELRNQWSQVASKTSSTGVKQSRLKGFNLVDIVKDGELFIVDAPKRNGADNSITLTIGEPFVSRYTNKTYRVKSVEYINDQPRLIVTGNSFIDQTREEPSEAELKQIQASKREKAKEQKRQAMAKAQVKKEQTRLAQSNHTKTYLKGWSIIAPIKDQQRVVVYNPNTEKAEHLQINQYVAGVGNVRTIDFKTGETCFEKTCIAGLQF